MDPPAPDRGESIGLMEPILLGDGAPRRDELMDLAVELTACSAGLRRGLPPGIAESLAPLMRATSCYYSNLIDGHTAHPMDIERALKGHYSNDAAHRLRQHKAEAHIEVQAWIDAGGLDGRALTGAGLRETHRRFCARLPEELRCVVDPGTGERVPLVPGAFRHRDVRVGRHLPVSPGAVPRFVARLEAAHARLGRAGLILAAATAHHRLVWIHPFLDGNGRVARLVSYAVLREALDTGGLWSVARGLARQDRAYKAHLAACHEQAGVEVDGHGRRSQQALADFAVFFLEICVAQVRLVESLMQPDRLRDRVLVWAEEEVRGRRLPGASRPLLEAVLYRGRLERGEAAAVLGTGDRQARRVTAALLDREVLTADGPRAPLRLAFPAALAPRWMPGLFPEAP